MSAAFGSVLIAMTLAALVSAAAPALVKTKSLQEITRIAGALVMILAVASPLAGNRIDLDLTSAFESGKSEMEQSVKEGQEKQQTLIKSAVSSQIAEYIEEKAKSEHRISCRISFESVVDEDGVYSIRSAVITYDQTPTAQEIETVATLIEKECGLEKSLQQHKGR